MKIFSIATNAAASVIILILMVITIPILVCISLIVSAQENSYRLRA